MQSNTRLSTFYKCMVKCYHTAVFFCIIVKVSNNILHLVPWNNHYFFYFWWLHMNFIFKKKLKDSSLCSGYFLRVSACCLSVLAWVNVSYYTICKIMCARLFYVLVHDLFVKMRNLKISLFSFNCWLDSNLNENCFKTLTYYYKSVLGQNLFVHVLSIKL